LAVYIIIIIIIIIIITTFNVYIAKRWFT